MAITAVASTTTSTTLLAAGAERNVVIISNSDANDLYVLLDGGTASASNQSFTLAQGENALVPNFAGQINGIWAGDGTGSAHITTY